MKKKTMKRMKREKIDDYGIGKSESCKYEKPFCLVSQIHTSVWV